MATRTTLIQQVAVKHGVPDITRASCEQQYMIYKATLKEIERTFRNENVAKQTLRDIKKALNDITNGFQDLRSNPKFNKKREITRVTENLIKANKELRFALEEWRSTGKSRDHFDALGWCKEHVFQINLQLA